MDIASNAIKCTGAVIRCDYYAHIVCTEKAQSDQGVRFCLKILISARASMGAKSGAMRLPRLLGILHLRHVRGDVGGWAAHLGNVGSSTEGGLFSELDAFDFGDK